MAQADRVWQLTLDGFGLFTRYIVRLGDVNGDDLDDLAMRSELDPTYYFYSGSAVPDGRTETVANAFAHFALPDAPFVAGFALDAGDVDDDGVGDVWYGTENLKGWSNTVHLINGPFVGEVQPDNDGSVSILTLPFCDGISAAGGEANGDGLEDLVLAEPMSWSQYEYWTFVDSRPPSRPSRVSIVVGPFDATMDVEDVPDRIIFDDDEPPYLRRRGPYGPYFPYYARTVALTRDGDGDGIDEVLVGCIWCEDVIAYVYRRVIGETFFDNADLTFAVPGYAEGSVHEGGGADPAV